MPRLLKPLLTTLLAAAGGAALLSGCYTARGVGADLESVAAAFDPAYNYRACGSYGPIDHDNDGKISRAEWSAYRAGAWRGWDLNGDGRISRREYANCWYGGGFYPRYTKANWEPSWTAFDANGDGWISSDEYYSTAAYSPLDRNGDGYIDASEWPW